MPLNQSSQSELLTAWELFIEQGIIRYEIVRPLIAESWQRSSGVDPRSRNWHQLPNRILQTKRAENIRLISLARPIMDEISHILNNGFVLLADKEAYILEAAGNTKLSPSPGILSSEELVGTNIIGTTLIEQSNIEIKGPEHYSIHLHDCYSAGAPIYDIYGHIVGVIAIANYKEALPVGILQTLGLAVSIVENQLKYKAEQSKVLNIYHNTCSSIIDLYQDALIVIDSNFTISNLNEKCLDLLGNNDRKSLVGKLIDNLIADQPQLVKSLLSSNPNEFISKFNLKGNNGIIPCTLLRRRIIRNPDNTQQTVLVFNATEPEYGSALARVSPDFFDDENASFTAIIGDSQAINLVKNMARKAAQVASNVLIEGESGTGKELIAQAIHKESDRSGPFVAINCGAIPKELLQSELFGYEEGAFTGARKGGNIGKFELADQGTIFLDEIGEMPIDMQVNLLRFLQDKTIYPVGSNNPRVVDVRIIAATNRNLKKEIGMGRFREDLYYRLNVININILPLRERKIDIPVIARTLIETLCRQLKRDSLAVSDSVMSILLNYNWPGNVRELKNVLENAVVFCEGNLITEAVLPSCLKESLPVPSYSIQTSNTNATKEAAKSETLITLEDNRKYNKALNSQKERDELSQLLDQYDGNISKVARHLGVSRNTVYRKMRSFLIAE